MLSSIIWIESLTKLLCLQCFLWKIPQRIVYQLRGFLFSALSVTVVIVMTLCVLFSGPSGGSQIILRTKQIVY